MTEGEETAEWGKKKQRLKDRTITQSEVGVK